MTAMAPPIQVDSSLTRRSFIRTATLGAALSTLALFGASTGFLLWPRGQGARPSDFTVAAADVPTVQAPPYGSVGGRYYLIHIADGLLALSWRCPYKGCRALLTGHTDGTRVFRCPCCGSTFDITGVSTEGPAPRPLDLLRIRVSGDGTIKVDPDSVSSRAGYLPQQAVPYMA